MTFLTKLLAGAAGLAAFAAAAPANAQYTAIQVIPMALLTGTLTDTE